jgi:Lrp/AsnC family transcriptional regulator for asnA, asnC and gidA
VHLDERDKAIIAELQRNGRASFAAVGRSVGMSEAAVRQRVHRLVRAGAIRVTAVTSPHCAGAHRLAVIGIRCAGDAAQVAEALSTMAELYRVAVTAGAFDVLVEAACSDDGHLLELIQRIRALPQVAGADVFIVLRQCLAQPETFAPLTPPPPPVRHRRRPARP